MILRAALWLGTILLTSAIIFGVSVATARYIGHYLEEDDLAGWAQAVGTVLAIVTGFASTLYQVGRQKRDQIEVQNATGRAAYLLSYDALETVSDRLEAALTPPDKSKALALRGDRTTEMVTAMRQFDTSRLPVALVADFVRLRSHVFAINQRISEVYEEEEKLQGAAKQRLRKQRSTRLASAVMVRGGALTLFRSLERVANPTGG
jgi:hypothetical protein